MTLTLFLRRGITLTSIVNSRSLSRLCTICSKASKVLDNVVESTQNNSTSYDSTLHLSPLFSHSRSHLEGEGEGYKIELVDTETWRVSSGLAEAWRRRDGAMEDKGLFVEAIDEVGSYSPPNKDLDFDEIEDMRIRGNLFYKLDKDSKEFEEYNFDFHRKKSLKNKDDQKENKKEKSNHTLGSGVEKSSKKKDEWRGRKNMEDPDFDEIENMKIQGSLFCELDMGAKEFEEYNFDFHHEKFLKGDQKDNKKKDNSNSNLGSGVENSSKKRDEWRGRGNMENPDFDEIENSGIRGNLLYKLDTDSKEFEEYNFDFRGSKSSKNKDDQKEKKENSNLYLPNGVEKSSKKMDESKGNENKENPSYSPGFRGEMDSYFMGKKVRTPTFNQITAPYHEPFCLDIYISNASVRACIIHRATSKVVAVAHSISKDMKFDLASTKNRVACAAVGEVLAQRALADDIYNAVYTPRKGEKLEGKLQIVLQSIIANGVNVKVKIKQRKVKKGGQSSTV